MFFGELTLHEAAQFADDGPQDPRAVGDVLDEERPGAEGGDDDVRERQVDQVVVERVPQAPVLQHEPDDRDVAEDGEDGRGREDGYLDEVPRRQLRDVARRPVPDERHARQVPVPDPDLGRAAVDAGRVDHRLDHGVVDARRRRRGCWIVTPSWLGTIREWFPSCWKGGVFRRWN